MEREITAARVPPYVSYRSFKTFIEDLRAQGIPTRIDRSVWGIRFSGSVGAQLMSALRFLRLIANDGEPTETLKSLVRSDQTEQWKPRLRSLLEGAYEVLKGVDLENTTLGELTEQFRQHYQAQDAVTRKCLSFLLHAAQDAGMEISRRVVRSSRRAYRPRISVPMRRGNGRPDAIAGSDPGRATLTPLQSLYELLAPEQMTEEEQQAVWTLIRYLKRLEHA